MSGSGGWVAIVVALITAGGVLGAKYLEVGGRASEPVAPASANAEGRDATADVLGAWRDQFESDFEISRSGEDLALRGTNGARVMEGVGAISGTRVTFAITNNVDPGTITCDGVVASPQAITSSCVEPDGSTFVWQLTR